mgnify:CR=1 FL=1
MSDYSTHSVPPRPFLDSTVKWPPDAPKANRPRLDESEMGISGNFDPFFRDHGGRRPLVVVVTDSIAWLKRQRKG